MEETDKNGSKITPEIIFRDHAPRIYNLARRMLGSDADAEDVTQDVLLQVVRKLDTFRGDSALSTWLHRITVNAALAHRRKRAMRDQRQVTDPLDHFLDNGHHHHPVRRWSVVSPSAVVSRTTAGCPAAPGTKLTSATAFFRPKRAASWAAVRSCGVQAWFGEVTSHGSSTETR